MAYTHSIKHGPVAELEILDLVENAKSWSVPSLDFAPVGNLSNSGDIASSLESMYQLLEIANGRFECSPYVQHLCSFVNEYLLQLLPSTNFAMPAAVPRYQEPIEGEIFHFRFSNFIVLRSLTLRYPNSTVQELASSLHQITHDMEAVQEAGNNFVLWQLMAYFLFDLCGIMQSDVSVEGTLEGLYRILGIPSMLFDMVATTIRDAPSSLVEQKMSHGVTVAHMSGLGSASPINEICFVQGSQGGRWTLWACAEQAAHWCSLRQDHTSARETSASGSKDGVSSSSSSLVVGTTSVDRKRPARREIPAPKCWCDTTLVEDYFSAVLETVVY